MRRVTARLVPSRSLFDRSSDSSKRVRASNSRAAVRINDLKGTTMKSDVETRMETCVVEA